MRKKSGSKGGGGIPGGWFHLIWMIGGAVAPVRQCPGCGGKTQLWRRNCPGCGRKLW